MNLKNVIIACICSYCENIYEYNTIDSNKFVNLLKYFLTEDNLEDCLETCIHYTKLDCKYIDNICNDNLNLFKYHNIKKENIISKCEHAFIETIEILKTIDIKVFLESLIKEINVRET